MEEKPKRSLAKTLTWRVLATIITIILVYLVTGKIALSITVGALEVVLKLIFYYFHERAWNIVNWGKTNQQNES